MLESLRRSWRELGTRLALLYFAHRLLQLLSRGHAAIVPYGLYAQPLGRGGALLRPDTSTQVRQITASDPLNQQLPRPAEVIAKRHANGHQCHLALVHGQSAGTIWIAHDHYDEDEVRCRFVLAAPATSVWDYDVYVAPRYRLGRTMARLWAAVDQQLADEGVRWTFSRISRFNVASVTSHARLGAIEVGRATFVVLGRLQVSSSTAGPLLHVGWSHGPDLRLLPPA